MAPPKEVTRMDSTSPPRFQSKLEGFRKFLFNKEDKSVLGRTAASWGKVTLFYLIFYSCLAGFFALWLQVFFTTLDNDYPKLHGMTSLLKNNPGMGFKPQPDEEATLIQFTAGEPATYQIYVSLMDKFLAKYKDDSTPDDCKASDNANHSCRFDIAELGPQCTEANKYGYDIGKPCVILKLNKIYGFMPTPYSNETGTPPPADAITSGINNGPNWSDHSVGITCEGQNPGDTQNMGPVQFWPQDGFDIKYFPYMAEKSYLQPLVMIQFQQPKAGVLIQLWCKAWAQDIYHHKNDQAGSVKFEIMVDNINTTIHTLNK